MIKTADWVIDPRDAKGERRLARLDRTARFARSPPPPTPSSSRSARANLQEEGESRRQSDRDGHPGGSRGSGGELDGRILEGGCSTPGWSRRKPNLAYNRVMVLHILLEPGEDGFILASVPALPGCHTQGKSREEAIANAEEAIQGWLASQDLTEAHGGAEIVAVAV